MQSQIEIARRDATLSDNQETSYEKFMLPQYLRLNDAIEQFTADMVAHDPQAFRGGGGDIRYVVERQLFFALFVPFVFNPVSPLSSSGTSAF